MNEENKSYDITKVSERTPIAEMVNYFEYIDQLRSQIMKEGTDWDTIPGTKKPTLLQPGAQKLAFAFKMTDEYEILAAIEEHDKTYEYEKTGWKDGKKTLTTQTARGFYFYKIKCNLISRETGQVIADHIGICSSYDPGKEGAPANTIMMIAQKRAYVAAVRSATFTSDRFTQDVEEYPPSADGQEPDGRLIQATEKQVAFIRQLLQSSGVPATLKMEISKWLEAGDYPKGKAHDYIDQLQAVIKSAEPKDKSQKVDLSKEICSTEKKVIDAGLLDSKDIPVSRKQYAGDADFSKCTPENLQTYLDNLRSLLGDK